MPQKTDAQDSGNTKTESVLRARSYQLTLNNIYEYEELFTYLMSLKTLTYIISCLEIAPTTGKEHIHIYIHFKTSFRLSIKKCRGAHIEICRGSPQQNIDYIRKGGDENIIDEEGTEPRQGACTVGELKKISDPNELDWKQYNTWKKLKQDEENKFNIEEDEKNVTVYYIEGNSGTGKTRKAKEIIKKIGEPFNKLKYENGFWNGVGDCKIALYDDWRDNHMKPSEFLHFIDYEIHNMNIKGGYTKNRFTTIIITSIQRLDEIYKHKDDEERLQWERRITEVITM